MFITTSNNYKYITEREDCYLHTVEVTGSNPVPPTMNDYGYLCQYYR